MINIKQNRILPQIVRRLFSPPYLSRKIVLLPLLIIFIEAVLRLISQPPEFWIDYSLAKLSPDWIQQILAIHPLLFLGVVLLNIILIGLLLEGLSRTPALILWVSVSFAYLNNVLRWVLGHLIEPLTLIADMKNILSLATAIVTIAFVGWILVNVLNIPYANNKAAPRLKPVAIGSMGVCAILLIFGVFRAKNAPVNGWFLIAPEHSPTPRVNGEIVFDSVRDKALLFGGSGVWTNGDWQYDNETWEWNGRDWTQHFPENAPPGRGSLGMAFDASKNEIILFGGSAQSVYFDDTWEWDGETWRNLNPANRPSARDGHEMVYDIQRGQVVLYGGHDSFGNYLNDAWAWDGQTWNPIPFETTSPQASNFVLSYDPLFDRSVAFLSGCADGTWFWREDRWAKLDPIGAIPQCRGNAANAYDLAHEYMVMFGGTQGEELVNETWLFDGLQWREVDLPLSASARWGHSAFYDETREKVVVYGGFDGTNYLNDMWELSLPIQD